MANHTYIQLRKETAQAIKILAMTKRESYDEILNRLLKEYKDDEPKTYLQKIDNYGGPEVKK